MVEISRVSILIPCYNAERWIAEAIESALAQTWPNKEVIVVDDGSTDHSLEVIRSFGDRIRWETGPNRGGNAARNRLTDLATGEWLQYLDADDYLLHDKITSQFAEASESPSADVLYSPMTLEHWREGQAPLHELLELPETHDAWALMARWQFPGTHAVLLRRAAVEEVGGWMPDATCCQERELFVRMLKANKRFVFCPSRGAIYRQWSDSTVSKRDPLLNLQKRLQVIESIEEHLLAAGQLIPIRQDAIAYARLECARGIYRFDRSQGIECAARAIVRHPGFRLPPAPCFSLAYRLAFRVGGFEAAEWIALRTVQVAADQPTIGHFVMKQSFVHADEIVGSARDEHNS